MGRKTLKQGKNPESGSTGQEFKFLPICSDIYREFQTEFRIVSDICIDFQNILFKTTNSGIHTNLCY